jgi:hypothetical protein
MTEPEQERLPAPQQTIPGPTYLNPNEDEHAEPSPPQNPASDEDDPPETP